MPENLYIFLLSFAHLYKKYDKGEYILSAGTVTENLGIVTKGSVQIERNDFWGSRTIMDKLCEGGFFAETYAITGETLLVDVVAVDQCEIAFVNINSIIHDAKSPEVFKLINLLLKISASKNLNFSRKIMFITPKSIRERLSIFLTYQAQINKKTEFEISFDRQTLADYLNLDRSAMSKELGKMKEEGLIDTKKNWFSLKKLQSYNS